ncbi:MAG: DUF5686 family protein [Fluviicola sp.]
MARDLLKWRPSINPISMKHYSTLLKLTTIHTKSKLENSLKFTLFALILFIQQFSFSQIQILDLESKEAIPFVKVIPENQAGFLTDIDGYFTINNSVKSFQLKSYGFKDTTIIYSGEKVIYLQELASEIEEVVILPGENPAEIIMEKAIENRKVNHPKGDLSYKCTNYSKFLITITPETLLSIPDTTTDSILINVRNFFDKQHLFLLESTSDKYYRPPFREKEVITAYEVSGLTDPMFSNFANEMQSFHFYENQFQILGLNYISPLAFGSVRRYLFILEDSTLNESGDTTFTIRFRPRKDKNFDGMEGTLFINSNGWAVEKVIARPKKDSDTTINIEIVQEYEWIDNKKWFPKKLSTEFYFPNAALSTKINNAALIGKGSTYIERIELGIDLSDEKFNNAELITQTDANEKDSLFWNQSRKYELDEKEKNTFITIDSISKKYKLERKMLAFTSLFEGKIPLGKFQIDLGKSFRYTYYEKLRLGLALETSDRFSKRFQIGGYYVYGTNDKQWKHGAYSSVLIHPKSFLKLDFLYKNDIEERGENNFTPSSLGFDQTRVQNVFYINEVDQQRLAQVGLSMYLRTRLFTKFSGSYERILFKDGYTFKNNALAFENFSLSAEFRYTPGEKIAHLGYKRMSLGTMWPVFEGKITQGISGVWKSTYDFTRYFIRMNHTIPIRAVGKLNTSIHYGKVIGDVPLFYHYTVEAAGGNWSLSAANRFETILSNTRYQKELFAVFNRFTFKEFKTNLKWTSPAVGFHHGFGTGNSANFVDHQGKSYSTLSKSYGEAGFFINNLLVSNFTGIGIGAFYHYLGDTHPTFEKNLTFKIMIGVKF